MDINTTVRAIAKEYGQIAENIDTCMEHDFAMDGSGDCGDMIYAAARSSYLGWCNRLKSKYGITLHQALEVMKAWGVKEVKHRPVKWFIKKNWSFEDGMPYNGDFSMTTWGSLYYELEQYIS